MRDAKELARELLGRMPVLPDMDSEHEEPEAMAMAYIATAIREARAEAYELAAEECERLAAEAAAFNMGWSQAAVTTAAQRVRQLVEEARRG